MTEPPITNLTDKFTALQELLASQHTEMMAAIAALRGTASLSMINSSIADLKGDPSASLNDIKTKISANGELQTDANDILTRLIAQFDAAVVTPTMKDLLLTINDDTAEIVVNTGNIVTNTGAIAANTVDKTEVIGASEISYVSSGVEYYPVSAQLIVDETVAIWSVPPAPFSDNITGLLSLGSITALQCDDWSQYRIFVSSQATQFRLFTYTTQYLPTNQWHVFAGNDGFTFTVKGNEHIEVTICPV